MNDLIVMLGYCAVYAIWVLVPLFPAILIYRLFPQAETQTQWKISGIALKAGGASGFYFAILALTFSNLLIPQSSTSKMLLPWCTNQKAYHGTKHLRFVRYKPKFSQARSIPASSQTRNCGNSYHLRSRRHPR